MGYEDETMRPYNGQSPLPFSTEQIDHVRAEAIASKLQTNVTTVEISVRDRKFDENYAFYHILGRRPNDVSRIFYEMFARQDCSGNILKIFRAEFKVKTLITDLGLNRADNKVNVTRGKTRSIQVLDVLIVECHCRFMCSRANPFIYLFCVSCWLVPFKLKKINLALMFLGVIL